jgi:hypothetical protein
LHGADTQPLAREAERQRQRVLRRASRHSKWSHTCSAPLSCLAIIGNLAPLE